ALLAERAGQTILADKGYRSAELDTFLTGHGATLIRPAFRNETPRPGARILKPLRQIIESVNQTLKAQLDLERHAARTLAPARAPALAAARPPSAVIWHNEHPHQTTLRPLTAYDH